MAQNDNLEVFQDLMLFGPDAEKFRLRKALISHAKGPWKHARDREDQLVRMGDADSVIAFERSEGEGIDAVGLVLDRIERLQHEIEAWKTISLSTDG